MQRERWIANDAPDRRQEQGRASSARGQPSGVFAAQHLRAGAKHAMSVRQVGDRREAETGYAFPVSPVSAGRYAVNVAPAPGWLSTVTLPPICLTTS